MGRISVKSAKAKGAKFQQKVRDRILQAFEPLDPDDVKSTAMGQGGEDIQLSPFARSFFPYSVECKKHKSFAIYSVYDQAQQNCGDYEPLVIIEADRRKPLVVVDMEHYFRLLEDKEDFDART